MSMTNAIMDFILMGLLIAALWFGVRLDKRLKNLRAAHEDFAKAVADLDQAAIRAHNSLKELRADADESQDLLHGRILAARELMQKLEAQTGRAERAHKELENGVNTMAMLQSIKAQSARSEPAKPEPVRAEQAPVRPNPLTAAQPDDDDYNPAWSARAAKAAVPVARRPFDRDIIRPEDDLPRPQSTLRPGPRAMPSLLPKVEEEDETEIMDKVQMSELVVANLNEMIRSLTLPTRQVLSVEDDLFGGSDQPAARPISPRMQPQSPGQMSGQNSGLRLNPLKRP